MISMQKRKLKQQQRLRLSDVTVFIGWCVTEPWKSWTTEEHGVDAGPFSLNIPNEYQRKTGDKRVSILVNSSYLVVVFSFRKTERRWSKQKKLKLIFSGSRVLDDPVLPRLHHSFITALLYIYTHLNTHTHRPQIKNHPFICNAVP